MHLGSLLGNGLAKVDVRFDFFGLFSLRWTQFR